MIHFAPRAAFAFLLLVAATAAGSAESLDKWGPYIDAEGKPGNKRTLGEVSLFLPLSQDARTLFFTDIRSRWADAGGQEGNFGLGVRRMLDAGWNLGGYAYLDRRRSDYGNYFSQSTVGVEALSQDWDLRLNAYAPMGTRSYAVSQLNTASVSGTTVSVRAGVEQSMEGMDAELGWRVPLFATDDTKQLRVYVGSYRFTGGDTPAIEGNRARLDLTFNEVPALWRGARLSLGLEVQDDVPRGPQHFGVLRLRIPLEKERNAARPGLSMMERRMTDPVIRDVDVVTGAGAFGATETATQTASGQSLTVLNSASTTGAALPGAVTAAGANSTVVLVGTFNTTATTVLQAGQTVMGRGTLSVRTPSGQTAVLSGPGATVSSSATAIRMANNATLAGMNATSTSSITVDAQTFTGVLISDNVINATRATGAMALDLRTTTNAVARGNTLNVDGGTAGAVGVQVSSANNLTFAGNILNLNNGAVYYPVAGNNFSSFNAGSTGNVTNRGSCNFVGGTPTGSIGFSTITCP